MARSQSLRAVEFAAFGSSLPMGIAGESEKSRLQRIMEWSNRGVGTPEPNRRRDDEAGTEEEQLIRKKVRGGVQKAKRWLDVLANEVVERETVLKVMRAEGQEQLSNTKLRDQIQQRIKRMKELQNIISRQERINKQSRMEAVLEDPTACCPATCSVQQQKDKTEATSQANSFSPQSKRLLDHGLSTSQNPPRNHHRYKHTHSAANLPFLEGSSAVNRAMDNWRTMLLKSHLKLHHVDGKTSDLNTTFQNNTVYISNFNAAPVLAALSTYKEISPLVLKFQPPET